MNRRRFDRGYDAVVIGTGIGGATCALKLARLGREVLLLEQGGFLTGEAISAGETSRYIIDVVPTREDPLHFVGGQTKFFGAALYRFRESDFKETPLEAGVSPAWPVTYADLEAPYGEAEAIFKVHGDESGDPSAPPRAAPLPFPPVPYDAPVEAFAQKLRAVGANVVPIPRAVEFEPGGRCVNCPSCDAFLCLRNGKMDADVAAVRPGLATGRVWLETGVQVLKVVLDETGGRALGCQIKVDGEERFVEAGAVVVSCGLRGTVELLLRSRTPRHPKGVGGSAGQLGRNMAGHSTGMIFPIMSLGRLKPIQTKAFAINDFYDAAEGWDYPLGVIQLAGQMPFWQEASPRIRPIAKIIANRSFTFFYMTETAPSHEAGFKIEGDRCLDRIEPPHSLRSFRELKRRAVKYLRDAGYVSVARNRPPYFWHDVGTARMGSDPDTSVVDAFGQVHGVEGLYIADASVLPSAGAVNTGLTIAALAIRTAERLAGKLQRA